MVGKLYIRGMTRHWLHAYDMIDDFVSFFRRCKRALKPNGLIGVKENVTAQGLDIDKEDSSVTRFVCALFEAS